MGKLHTLKRAILRNPDDWRKYGQVVGAYYSNKEHRWKPYYSYNAGYRKFVIKTLKDLDGHK